MIRLLQLPSANPSIRCCTSPPSLICSSMVRREPDVLRLGFLETDLIWSRRPPPTHELCFLRTSPPLNIMFFLRTHCKAHAFLHDRRKRTEINEATPALVLATIFVISTRRYKSPPQLRERRFGVPDCSIIGCSTSCFEVPHRVYFQRCVLFGAPGKDRLPTQVKEFFHR